MGKENLGKHLIESRKLATMQRYHTRFELRPSTVASHSWFVSKIASHLCTIEKTVIGEDIDEGKVLFMAINHDITEPFTGDIPSPVKRANKEIQRLISELETEVMEDIVASKLPEEERCKMIDMFTEMKDLETKESKLVKSADIIDRLFECKEEIDLGNKVEFEEILKEDLEILRGYNLKSVNYLVSDVVKELNIQQYLSEEYSNILKIRG